MFYWEFWLSSTHEIIGFLCHLLNRKDKRTEHLITIARAEPACIILGEILLGEWEIKSLALRNLYCEMVSLSERLMKMSANEMSFAKCSHFYLQSNSESANQDINLISSWEGRDGYGHFLYFIRKCWKDNYSQNPYYLYNREKHLFY